METVAIVGVGLIGASFGLALRQAGFAGPILGISSPAAIRAGLSTGAITREATLQEAAEIADLMYLAQPIDRILQTIPDLGPMARAGCLVTDAGSTKREIVSKAQNAFPEGTFLGGHPMAGKEQRGAEAAEASLFRGRPYVLTPSGAMSEEMQEFQHWLGLLGARIVLMSATEHDNVVAFTSHLPQLLSTAISVTLAEQETLRVSEVFGPGLLDMTRLAMSSAEVWGSVLDTNRDEVLNALDHFASRLEQISATLKSSGNLHELFSVGQKFAKELRKPVR